MFLNWKRSRRIEEKIIIRRSYMHPTEVIEFMVVGGAVIIIISFILKGNWRKFGWAKTNPKLLIIIG